MADKARARLGQVGKTQRPSPAPSAVGDEITRHLRALQAERRAGLEVDAVVGALVPAVSALAGRGLLVSISITRDARSVRLSALIDREWIEWFADDPELAEELAREIAAALAD